MVWTTQLANVILHKLVETVFTIHQKLFRKCIDSLGKIRELYHVFHLLRRGSDSHALSEDVSEMDVDVVNQWAQKEKAKGKMIAQKKGWHIMRNWISC
jgi:hypothetical protein